MEALGYLVGVVVVAFMAWAALAPFLERRYPRKNKRPDRREGE